MCVLSEIGDDSNQHCLFRYSAFVSNREGNLPHPPEMSAVGQRASLMWQRRALLETIAVCPHILHTVYDVVNYSTSMIVCGLLLVFTHKSHWRGKIYLFSMARGPLKEEWVSHYSTKGRWSHVYEVCNEITVDDISKRRLIVRLPSLSVAPPTTYMRQLSGTEPQ